MRVSLRVVEGSLQLTLGVDPGLLQVEDSSGMVLPAGSTNLAEGLLGLSPAAEIIRANLGEVEIRARSGRTDHPGSVCLFCKTSFWETPFLDKSRILIVDDEPNVRFVLERTLVNDGYLLETATDGADAIRKLGQATYDLVLLDLEYEAGGGHPGPERSP